MNIVCSSWIGICKDLPPKKGVVKGRSPTNYSMAILKVKHTLKTVNSQTDYDKVVNCTFRGDCIAKVVILTSLLTSK